MGAVVSAPDSLAGADCCFDGRARRARLAGVGTRRARCSELCRHARVWKGKWVLWCGLLLRRTARRALLGGEGTRRARCSELFGHAGV